MATGTVKWFTSALLDMGNKIHDLDSDTLKLAIVTNTTVPAITTAAPHFGGTGTTNFAPNQVGLATGYSGPITLANKTWSIVSGVPTFRADPVTIPQDASGFANGAWGIIFNDSDANKRALGYVEISAAGSASNVAGQLVLDWNGATNDILNLTNA